MFPNYKKWIVFAPWNKSNITSQFSSLDAVFKLDGKIISKSSQSEIFSHSIEGKPYFIKRYFRSKNIGSWLGFSRFQVESRNQLWFNKQGIPSARVVAVGEESFFLKTKRGVLITEGIQNVKDLLDIAKNSHEKLTNTEWRNYLISQIADVTAKLHQNRFCHNDLHWRNILVQEDQNNKPRIYLIDCPSGKRLFWPLLHYRIIKDLATLDKKAPKYLTRTQRLRFFLAYRKTSKLSLEDKKLLREILDQKAKRQERKTLEKIAKNRSQS